MDADKMAAAMRVGELRDELGRRGLSTIGLKSELVARLSEAIEKDKGPRKLVQHHESASKDLKRLFESGCFSDIKIIDRWRVR